MRSIRRAFIVLVLSVVLVGAMGCENSATTQPAPQSLPTVQMTLGKQAFNIEIANTDPTREMGLMYRDSMPADHGMIFVFAKEQPLSFWMKNTRIPLDIAYLDATGRIVSIKSMKAYDLTGVPSDYPAKYAIELNQGAAAAAGLRVGDVIQIPKPASSADQ